MQQQRKGGEDYFTVIITVLILFMDKRWEENESEIAITIPPPTATLPLQ